MKNIAVNQFLHAPEKPTVKDGNWTCDRDHVRTALYFKNILVAKFYLHTAPIQLHKVNLVMCDHEWPRYNAILRVVQLIRRGYKTRRVEGV